MRITPVLLLALLLGSAAAQIYVPITVHILNVPPEILELKFPETAPASTPIAITVRVRDNNTLNDITTAWAWRTGMNDQNVTATISNTTNSYSTGDYTFTFITDFAGGLSGQIFIGDEETTHIVPFNIPREERKNLTLITGQVNINARPGSTATAMLQIKIDTTDNTTLYAAIHDNSGIHAKLNGVPIQGTATKIKNYPPTLGEDSLILEVSVPSVYPDIDPRQFSITLSLGDQEATAEIEIYWINVNAIIAILIFAACLLITLGLLVWRHGLQA